MSVLVAAPELLADAASDLTGLGSTISTANATAAARTTGLLPAAADEVSAEIARLFSAHAQGFQRLSTQVAAFHEQFVQNLTASTNAYATAEATAVQTLLTAVHGPAQALWGHPTKASAVVSGAVGRVESALQASAGAGLIGGGFQGVRSALHLTPTGAGSTAALSGALSSITNAAARPAALIPPSVATNIENLYLRVEPYVQYGFQLLAYAVGFVLPVGPQINFFYNLFEPMVQAALFNTLDWLSGTITFSAGLANFWSATTSSVNAFIQAEIAWIRGFFPPLPPFL
jgi:hypothetical protein